MLIAQWNILNRASDGWEAKGAVLADALVRRGVDAACLQEVPADGLDTLTAAFAERGLTLAAGRLRQGRTDLCAVCWRTGALEPVGGPSSIPGVDCAIQTFEGLTVCSYHGAWGAFRQRERLDEARLLDVRLSRRAAKGPVLLCGDFNAMSGEPAIRLLSGLTEAPTFWTEAQDTAVMPGRAARIRPPCRARRRRRPQPPGRKDSSRRWCRAGGSTTCSRTAGTTAGPAGGRATCPWRTPARPTMRC